MKTSLLLSLCIFLFACSSNEPDVSPEVTDFLNELMDLMEQNSVNKAEINWTEFRSQVFEEADGAITIDDASEAITEALTLLCDRHSFFISESSNFIGGRKRADCTRLDIVEPVPESEQVGYVQIDAFVETSPDAMLEFALNIQKSISEQDSDQIKGWIIDLRQNGGGNMFPMLAGVGSILGEGIAGHFVGPDGTEIPWGYNNGSAWNGQNTIVTLPDPYELIKPFPRVAVLTDNGVASSGEALAISFIGRDNTRSFGEQTCGLSTANAAFNLASSGTLILTISTMADRNKNLYGESIQPDVNLGPKEAVQAAIDFIME